MADARGSMTHDAQGATARPVRGGLPVERPPWDEPPHHGEPAVPRRLTRTIVARWALIALLVLGPLLVVETGVRVLIATGRLPIAAAHLADFEITWTNQERGQPVDVLFLGDSMTQQGLDPQALSDHLEQELGHPVRVFNVASSAGGFGVNRAVVDQLAREGRLPKVAVVGVAPPSMTSDRTFRDVFAPTPMGGLFTRCSEASGYDETVNCEFGNVSAFWRWRGSFDRVVRALLRPIPRTASDDGFELRENGFRAGPPAPVTELEAQVSEALSREPRSYRMGDDVPPAYHGLIAALRERGVPIVAVTIPYSPVLLDGLEARQPGWEAAREAAVARLAAAEGIPIVDPIRFGAWWGDGASRDVKHLSRAGAPLFMQQLWDLPGFREPILAALR